MSAGTGGYRWDDPNRTGINQGGFYDQNTMKGLILRSQRGDLAAKNHLKQAGFTDQWGNNLFGAGDVQAGAYDAPINAWAQSRNLKQNTSGPAFQWNDSYTAGDPSFDSTWNSFFSGQGQPPASPGLAPAPPPAAPVSPEQLAAGHQTLYPSSQTTAPTTIRGNPGLPSSQAPHGSKAMYEALINEAGNYGGQQFVNGAWQGGGPVKAGTYILGGVRTLVNYDKNADTTVHGFNDKDAESNWRQVNRYWMDFASQGANPQDAYYSALSRLKRDYEQANKDWHTSGFDLTNVQAMPVTATAVAATPPALAQQAGIPVSTATPAVDPKTGQPVSPAPVSLPGQQTQDPAPAMNTDPTTGGDNSGLRNIAIASDPNAQALEFYKRIGLDPNDNGLYTSSITNTTDPILQAWMQFNQINSKGPGDPNAIDTVMPRIEDLARLVQQGNGMGQIRQNFRQTMQDPRFAQTVRDLGDQGGINLMQTGIFGANAGSNALVSKAMANRFQRSLGPQGAFAQYALDNLGNPNYLRPRDWLLQSQYADLLNGL